MWDWTSLCMSGGRGGNGSVAADTMAWTACGLLRHRGGGGGCQAAAVGFTLPGCFLDAGDETCRCHFAELNTRDAELADVSLGTACDGAAVVEADGIAVLGERLELLCCLVSLGAVLFVDTLVDNLLELGTLLGVLGCKTGALHFAGLH